MVITTMTMVFILKKNELTRKRRSFVDSSPPFLFLCSEIAALERNRKPPKKIRKKLRLFLKVMNSGWKGVGLTVEKLKIFI